jgi:hypothetical protein
MVARVQKTKGKRTKNMRSNLKKMRIKKVSKKASGWRRDRLQNKLFKANVINTIMETHMRKDDEDGYIDSSNDFRAVR